MDERFRCLQEKGESNRFVYNGFSIVSCQYPQIFSLNYVYLRGFHIHKDAIQVSYNFQSNEEALDFIKRFKGVLKNWAENWHGWQ